jgi:two-component system response regulator DevR
MKLKKLQVLIVDDSELMCTHLAKALSEIVGAEVVGIALTVADAYCYLDKISPDLAILDICLPDGSGIDIIKKIRDKGYPSKIAIFTHYPYAQYQKKSLEAGADHFFDKYADFEKLLGVVRELNRHNAEPANRG